MVVQEYRSFKNNRGRRVPALLEVNSDENLVNYNKMSLVNYYYYYCKCQDLSDAITTIVGALYIVYQ